MLENILSLAFQGTRRKKQSSILIFAVLLVSFSFAIVALCLVGSISKTVHILLDNKEIASVNTTSSGRQMS